MNPSDYCDKDGYPGAKSDNQPDGQWDGGDTTAILGTLVALSESGQKWPWIILMSFLNWGIPLRHPDMTKWYGQRDRFSRDQLIPVICAAISTPHNITPADTVFRFHKQKWFLTAWNTRGNGEMDMPKKWPDFTGPEVWALWLRFKKPWWRHLFLWALDIETLIGSVIWKFKKSRVTRNHMLVSITAYEHSPTWTSRLAFWLNDWHDLLQRWLDHCNIVGEYPSGHLFRRKVQLIYAKQGEPWIT